MNHFLLTMPIYFLFVLLFTNPASGKLFRNSYIAFELPENWKCDLEKTEWVCRNSFKKQAKEAIIILTAKEVGPTDTFAAYETHLKTPRTITSRSGQPLKSKIYHVKKYNINNHPWIDGWHFNSEISGYYTRYLATVKQRIAVLITFSAHRNHYTKYSKDFFTAIKSLRVIANQQLADRGKGSYASGESLGGSIAPSLPKEMFNSSTSLPNENKVVRSRQNRTYMILGFAILLAAIGAYLILKK